MKLSPQTWTSNTKSKEMVGKGQNKEMWNGSRCRDCRKFTLPFQPSWTKTNNNNNNKFQGCKGKEHQTLWVELGEHSMRLKQPIQKISPGHMGWWIFQQTSVYVQAEDLKTGWISLLHTFPQTTSLPMPCYHAAPRNRLNLRREGRPIRNSHDLVSVTLRNANPKWFFVELFTLVKGVMFMIFMVSYKEGSRHQFTRDLASSPLKRKSAHFVSNPQFTNDTFECFPNLGVDAMCSWWLMCI